jgi:hypothetical protein
MGSLIVLGGFIALVIGLEVMMLYLYLKEKREGTLK